MFGAFTNFLQSLADPGGSSTRTNHRVENLEGQMNRLQTQEKRDNNMKQKTGVHIHINNYARNSTKPARQLNLESSNGYQKYGQNQGKTKAIEYSSNTQNAGQSQNSQKSNYNQGTKPFYQNSKPHPQGANRPFNQGQRNFNPGQKSFSTYQGNQKSRNNQGTPQYNQSFRPTSKQCYDSGRDSTNQGQGKFGNDGNYRSNGPNKVIVIKKTQVINKKIIVKK